MKKIIILIVFMFSIIIFVTSCTKKEESNINNEDSSIQNNDEQNTNNNQENNENNPDTNGENNNQNNNEPQTIKIYSPFSELPWTALTLNNLIKVESFQERLDKVEKKYNCKIEFINSSDVLTDNNLEYSGISDCANMDFFERIKFSHDLTCSGRNTTGGVSSYIQDKFEEGRFRNKEVSAIYLPYSDYAYDLIKNNNIYDLSNIRNNYSYVYYQPLIFNNILYGIPITSKFNNYYFNIFSRKKGEYIYYNDVNELTCEEEEKESSLKSCSFLGFYFKYLAANNIKFADFSSGEFIDKTEFIATVQETYNLFIKKYASIHQAIETFSHIYRDYLYGRPVLDKEIITKQNTIRFFNLLDSIDNFYFGYSTFQSDFLGLIATAPMLLDNPKWYTTPTEIENIYGNKVKLDKEIIEGIYGLDLSQADYKNNIEYGDGIYVLNYDLDEIRTKEYTANIINELFPTIEDTVEIDINHFIENFLPEESYGYLRNLDKLNASIEAMFKSVTAKDNVIYDAGPSLALNMCYVKNISNEEFSLIEMLYDRNSSEILQVSQEEFIERMLIIYNHAKTRFDEIYNRQIE